MEQSYEVRIEGSRFALLARYFACFFLVMSIMDYIGKYESFFIFLSDVLWAAVEGIVEKIWGSYKIIHITFREKSVTLYLKRKEIEIPYTDIKEVGKTMLITRSNWEKGNYQLKIKTKKRNYRIATPIVDYDKHLDFEDTEFAALYKAFKEHGVKCC